jgi:large subunit ribosomal protein L9
MPGSWLCYHLIIINYLAITMKVVLLEKYKKLGEVGEVVDVKNGYARNYLIPNAKAVQATKTNVAKFEARKAELLEKSKLKEEEANKVASKIKGSIIAVIKQAGDDGRLYGAVNSSEIADGLAKIAKTPITRKQVILNYAIKFAGVYQIDIDLGEGVFGEVYINISRSEGEAEEVARKFKSGEVKLTTVNSDSKFHHAAEEKPAAKKAEAVEAPAAEEAKVEEQASA